MKSVTFELYPDELEVSLLDSIKLLFKGKKVKITVIEDFKPAVAQKTLFEIIEESKKNKSVVQITSETLDLLAEKLQNDCRQNWLCRLSKRCVCFYQVLTF